MGGRNHRNIQTAGNVPIRALNRACSMLLALNNKDTSINQISDECGFDNVDQFKSQFQKSTGWYPEEWRRNIALL